MARAARLSASATLLCVVAAAWVASAARMRGMTTAPRELGPFASFVATWAAMTAAMMLPSALGAATRSQRSGRAGSGLVFATAYVGVWVGVGVAVFAAFRAVGSAHVGDLDWGRGGRYLAAGALAAAALYELTPLRRRCLARCRAARTARVSGFRYGFACLGCSAAPMVVLFAVGLMSIAWMTLVTVVVALEKATPLGSRLVPVVAASLLCLASWLALAPESVPAAPQRARAPEAARALFLLTRQPGAGSQVTTMPEGVAPLGP